MPRARHSLRTRDGNVLGRRAYALSGRSVTWSTPHPQISTRCGSHARGCATRRQQRGRSPDNRGEEDCCAGEDAERAAGERHRERLRASYAGSDQSGGAGADLCRRARRADRHRRRCRARTEQEQRQWEREADPECPEKEEGGDCAAPGAEEPQGEG